MLESVDDRPTEPIRFRARSQNRVEYEPKTGYVHKLASLAPSRLLGGQIADPQRHLLPCFGAINDRTNTKQETLWLYCPGGDLQRRFNSHQLVDGSQLTLVQQVMTGWRNLRRCYRLIHLDLKPSNILWGGSTHGILIADFELAADCDGEEEVEISFRGTRGWMAPEQVAGEKTKKMKVSEKTDIWILGRVIIWLYTRRLNPSDRELRVMPKWLRCLVTKMMEDAPADRPSLSELEEETMLWTSDRSSPALETIVSSSIAEPTMFSSTGTAVSTK